MSANCGARRRLLCGLAPQSGLTAMTIIGFIGLGHMGVPMARNLMKAGYRLKGFDILDAACRRASEDGVDIAASAADAVRDAAIVITMLPAGGDVLAAYGDPLIGASRTGTLFIDCSTIDVASARRAHEIAAAAGMQALDA